MSWERFTRYYCHVPVLDMSIDVSRIRFDESFFGRMEAAIQNALSEMERLEKGSIANPDEKRMVGHYWLRTPELAPSPEIAHEIRDTVAKIKQFSKNVHEGVIKPTSAPKFTRVLSIGIGGSALGPMFVADALGDPLEDRMQIEFIDNTDPEGIARVLKKLGKSLQETLCIVTSKSGGTPETRNGMLLVADAYQKQGLEFAKHAVAITMAGSQMEKVAIAQNWMERFPMFDWIGGRTSELSAVGLLPAALQGLDIDAMLRGAAVCDQATRHRDVLKNPAALLALMWYQVTNGRGEKDMVVLPYKDRLLLFSRYLQQLVMESLGKQCDLQGKRVDQGLAVYGNKGSTDQHAYVQQLREGVPNFFATFIRVLENGGSDLQVEPHVTSGDFLHGFLMGTRQALDENDRESITITVPKVDAAIVGALIALFERAVGLYASLIGVNAYHQPGVEAGKKAAAAVLALQSRVAAALEAEPQTAAQLSTKLGSPVDIESVYWLLEHMAANRLASASSDPNPATRTFSKP